MRVLYVALLVLLICAAPAAALPQAAVTVRLYCDGGAYVVHRVPVQPPCIVSVRLLGLPSLLSVSDDSGNPLEYNLTGQLLDAAVFSGREVVVTYETFLGKVNDSYASYEIPGVEGTLLVITPPNSTLVYVYPFPSAVSAVNGSLELAFINVSMVQLDLSLGTGPETSAGPHGQAPAGLPIHWVAVAAAAGAGAALVLVAARRRRRGPPLVEDEEAIVAFIRRRGGRAYLSEIREYTGLPASTAWRKVRRLEKLGVVRITKTPAGLLVELV